MKEMFAPEKCPKCGTGTVVEHYDAGWRCICEACEWYGVFHFDKPFKTAKETMKNMPIIDDPEISEALRDIGL